MSAAAVRWFHSGAADRAGDAQEDAQVCLGGLRSGTQVVSLGIQRDGGVQGIQVRFAAGANGPGIGLLAASGPNSVTWTPPGGTIGAAVTLALNTLTVVYGGDTNQWIEVERISSADLSGSESIQLVDVYEGAVGFGEVASADAMAGQSYYGSVFPLVVEDVAVEDLTVWIDVDTDGYALAEEIPTASAIQTIADQNTAPSGVSWNTGQSAGTGINLGNFGIGDDVEAVWARKVIGAASDGAAGVLVQIRYQFTVGATTYAGVLRNRYHIRREDQKGFGMWVAEDGDIDWEGAYEEFFTEGDLDYDTTYAGSPSHTYQVGFRARNEYGLWETNFEYQTFELDASGDLVSTRPRAPEGLEVKPTTDGKVILRGNYYPARDGSSRAVLFAVWWAEGAAPDPDVDPVDEYVWMAGNTGIEQYSFVSDASLSGATIYQIARALRFVALSATVVSEGTQLPASGAGTIEGDFTGWPASATVYQTNGSLGRLEIFSYSSRTDSALTVGAGERGLYGTDEAASEEGNLLTPVKLSESLDSETADGEVIWKEAVQPLVHAFIDSRARILQAAEAGPDETVMIDAGENVYWRVRPGDLQFWLDTVLGCRILFDSRNVLTGWYFPNDVWGLDGTVSISGAGTGTVEVISASDVYWVVNGVRKLRWNLSAGAVQCDGFVAYDGAAIPAVFPQVPAWTRYAELLLNAWNPGRLRWEPVGSLKSDGTLRTQFEIDAMSYSQAQLEAL